MAPLVSARRRMPVSTLVITSVMTRLPWLRIGEF
jgi:hypothetical protein